MELNTETLHSFLKSIGFIGKVFPIASGIAMTVIVRRIVYGKQDSKSIGIAISSFFLTFVLLVIFFYLCFKF